MTKLLDADWLRSIQLFHQLYSSTINDFAKTNKMAESQMAESYLNVDIENRPQEELDKAIKKFYVEVCNLVMPIINYE